MKPISDHWSVPALIAYALLAEIFFCGLGLFIVVIWRVDIKGDVLALLGGFLAAVYGFCNLALGFWLGTTNENKVNQATVAQLAGAGPPPPAAPLAQDTPA